MRGVTPVAIGPRGRWLAIAALIVVLTVARAGSAAGATTSWQLVQLHGTAAKASWTSVSCGAAGSCVVAGFRHEFSPVGISLVDHGGQVKAHTGPAMTTISCRGKSWCMATGWTVHETYAARWSQGRWGKVTEVRPGGRYGPNPMGVSCGSRRSCFAYGFQMVVTNVDCPPDSITGSYCDTYKPYISRWRGRGWHRVTGLPLPVAIGPRVPVETLGPIAFMQALGCAGPGHCVAVAGWSDGQPRSRTPVALFADVWNGHRWSLTHIPTPHGSTDAQIASVACSAANRCLAVGSYNKGPYPGYALADRWNGRRWSAVKLPGNARRILPASVSCVHHGPCVVAGSRDTAIDSRGVARHIRPLVLRWQRGGWMAEQTAKLPNLKRHRGDAYLNDISCATGRFCEAIGSYGDFAGRRPVDFIERYSPRS